MVITGSGNGLFPKRNLASTWPNYVIFSTRHLELSLTKKLEFRKIIIGQDIQETSVSELSHHVDTFLSIK